jgi:hypothetical protein
VNTRTSAIRQQRQIAWQTQQEQRALAREQRRLSRAQQQQIVTVQQQRAYNYSQRLAQQEQWLQQQTALLRNQQRAAQVRYQLDYLNAIRSQQNQVASQWNSYDYYGDPYFYTAPTYSYNYSGRTYQTNQYGVDALTAALNYGYQQGYLAGQADRTDNWNFAPRNSFAYQDANYGYNGLYLDPTQYNGFFRDGFTRGYSDGFYTQTNYGSQAPGGLVLSVPLGRTILHLQFLG